MIALFSESFKALTPRPLPFPADCGSENLTAFAQFQPYRVRVVIKIPRIVQM